MKKLNFDLTIAANALLCPNPQEFYSKCYLTDTDLANFRVIPGVKTSTKVSTLNFPNVLKAETCDFSASASALSATTFSVCPLQIQLEICKKTIETSYLSLEMAKGSSNWTVAGFMNTYWDILSQEVGEELGYIRWIGDTNGTGSTYTGDNSYRTLCDGYVTLMEDDGAVVDVAKSATTTSNVISVIGVALQAASVCVQSELKGLTIYAATNVMTNYRIAAALGNNNTYITEQLNLTFAGVRMVEVPQLPNDNIVITRKDNLLYLLDGEGDSTDLKAIDLTETIGTPNLRTVGWMKVGFGLLNPSEIVFVH